MPPRERNRKEHQMIFQFSPPARLRGRAGTGRSSHKKKAGLLMNSSNPALPGENLSSREILNVAAAAAQQHEQSQTTQRRSTGFGNDDDGRA